MTGNTGALQADLASLHDLVSRAFVAWRDDVYHYLLTFGLPPPEAQDATQEVFLRLYMALRKNDEPIRNQRAWVFRVAHNLGLTLRSQDAALGPLEPALEPILVDTRRGPKSSLIERQKLQRPQHDTETRIARTSPHPCYWPAVDVGVWPSRFCRLG